MIELIKAEHFIFHVDFVVLDMEEDMSIPHRTFYISCRLCGSVYGRRHEYSSYTREVLLESTHLIIDVYEEN